MASLLNVAKDQFVFEEMDFADCMYIIRSGEIGIYITDGETQKLVLTAQPGHLIGEMSLFDKKLRSASAKALADSSLVKLPYAKLESELSTMPEWVQVTLKTLSEKIREANNKLLNS